MADISSLGGLRDVETLDLGAGYKDSKESTFQLPRKGRYTVEAPSPIPDTAFSRTNAGALSAQIDPTIVGPTNSGFQLRYTKVSAKVFQRDGVNVSQVGDYLRATGFEGVLKTEQDILDAVEQTAGKQYEADLDWRAYSKATGWSIEGMEKFPKNPDGTHQSWILDPSGTDSDGAPLKLRANIFVRRFVAHD